MFGLGLPELLLIFLIGFVFFGAGKLPEGGKPIGKSMREFKTALNDVKPEITEEKAVETSKE